MGVDFGGSPHAGLQGAEPERENGQAERECAEAREESVQAWEGRVSSVGNHTRKDATEGPSAEATGSEPRRLARGPMEAATDVTGEGRNQHASQSDSVRGHPAIVVFRMVLGLKGQFGNRGGVPIVRAGAQENREDQRPEIRYEDC